MYLIVSSVDLSEIVCNVLPGQILNYYPGSDRDLNRAFCIFFTAHIRVQSALESAGV